MPELPPIVLGDAFLPVLFNDCGCCAGIDVETPIALFNRPDLPSIHYRVGTHGQFLESMLARLSSSDLPVLADLRTRDTDDFTIALLDGWATVADILTFYQERIANESYLRTATERRSIIELARLIGYQPHPGVSASTSLAFFLAEALGAPEQAIQRTRIPRGTRVQSVPGPGETPQAFETVEDFEARLAWNVLKPRTTIPQILTKGSTSAYLQGTDTGLSKGDAILFVGSEREDDEASNKWDLRFVSLVEPDDVHGHTRIEWVVGDDASVLRSVTLPINGNNPTIYALSIEATLFGHNAMDHRLLPEVIQNRFDVDIENYDFVDDGDDKILRDWSFPELKGDADLDRVYKDAAVGEWTVFSCLYTRKSIDEKTGNQHDNRKYDYDQSSGHHQLLSIKSIKSLTRASYGLSSEVTRLTLSQDLSIHFSGLNHRTTKVRTGTREFTLADAPVTDLVQGQAIVLDRLVPGLKEKQLVCVRGRSVEDSGSDSGGTKPDGGTSGGGLTGGTKVTVATVTEEASPAASLPSMSDSKAIVPTGGGGGPGADGDDGEDDGPAVPPPGVIQTELARIKRVEEEDGLTKLVFEKFLRFRYERASLEIFANVTAANHGESVSEIFGSGDASQPHQRFVLKQPPLTYVSATNPRGAETSLEVRVNDFGWKEVPTFHGRGPKDHVYTTEINDEGKVTVLFGDGLTGARLPTGQNNLRAQYRKGIGLGGNVAAGQISLLLSRPLGVQSVTNPVPATGGDDPESRDAARRNAPMTVLALDRVVSLQDYEDFARSFAGVAKALATWSWDGLKRQVCLTVAGPDGALIAEGGDLHANLVHALKRAGDPFVACLVKSFRPVSFLLAMRVKITPEYLPEQVLVQVELALRSAFGFDARALGQPVHLSEVIATVEGVEGVKAVDVDRLSRTKAPNTGNQPYARLPAQRPILGTDGVFEGAELLTVDAEPIVLRVMS